jgi:hypothetical protein
MMLIKSMAVFYLVAVVLGLVVGACWTVAGVIHFHVHRLC